MLSNNITRLSAEEDIRTLSVTAAAGLDKSFKQAHEALKAEMGEVFRRPDDVEGRLGRQQLKEMLSKMRPG